MRLALALALTLAADPAAACHRFSVWRYPTPQRCGLRLAQEAHPRPSMHFRAEVAPAREESRPAPPEPKGPIPFGPIDEDAARAKAIEKLKSILGDNQ
jgi:hypothetical protein